MTVQMTNSKGEHIHSWTIIGSETSRKIVLKTLKRESFSVYQKQYEFDDFDEMNRKLTRSAEIYGLTFTVSNQ